MPRVLWKGAISFGLVHIPVALYPASKEDGIDFDWLDRRTMDPVGYKRINKRTGREIAKEHIVKGVKREDDAYVVVSDDEIAGAYPKSTQTIEIEAFVDPRRIAFVHLDRPYYLGPIGKGAKVYALLREALLAAGRVGIARVVIASKEHLAAVIPAGPALMLNTLRWADQIRSWEDIDLPAAGRAGPGLKEPELKMATQLIDDMTVDWQPAQYADRFRDAIMALVDAKAAAGDTHAVEPVEPPADGGAPPSNVIDLTELLKRSLHRRRDGAAGDAGRKAPTAARKPAARAAGKTAAKTGTKAAAKPAARKSRG